MMLFLDVISPDPKFTVIDNNKVLESLHILNQKNIKISDCIHNKFFLFLKKIDNLLDLLDYLVVSTGPGSYTSLRVGISFMLGISYSKKLPIYGVTALELLSKFVMLDEFYKTIIIICSSSNQNFICLPQENKIFQYNVIKIDSDYSLKNINFKLYTKCISNFKLPNFISKKITPFTKETKYLNLEKTFNENFFTNNFNSTVLNPVYISENKLFD